MRKLEDQYSDDNCICAGEEINVECPRHGEITCDCGDELIHGN